MRRIISCIVAATTVLCANGQAKDVLKAEEILNKGQYISSKNGNYSLVMQNDGNLVMYYTPLFNGAYARYFSSDTRNSGSYVRMQIDGNLALYKSSNTWAWTSGTGGRPFDPGIKLELTDWGTLQIVNGGGIVIKTLNVDSCQYGVPATNYPAHSSANGTCMDTSVISNCGLNALNQAFSKGFQLGSCDRTR
jgi:hypothetical protein